MTLTGALGQLTSWACKRLKDKGAVAANEACSNWRLLMGMV
jgi:hypothetical protein